EEPEAEIDRDARAFVVRERRERSQSGDRSATCRDVAAPRRSDRDARRRLERRRIRRVELEDARVRRDGLAGAEPPRLERRERPQRAEPRTYVLEPVALPLEREREVRRVFAAPCDLLEETERPDVPRVAVDEALEERGRARQLLVRHDEERREH